MKKVRNYLLLVLFFIATGAMAQTVDVDWGSLTELQKDTWFHKLIGSDADGFYTLRSEGIKSINPEKMWLEYFSSAPVQLESSNEMVMPTINGVISKFVDMYYLNGKFILFSSIDNTNTSKKSLYVQYMNNNGTIKNKPKEIASVPVSNLPEDGFSVKLNVKDNTFLILCHPTFSEYNSEPITVKVLDLSLQESFAENFTFPLKGKTFTLIQTEINSKGDLFFLVKSLLIDPKEKGKSADGGATGTGAVTKNDKFDFSVLVYTLEKKEFTTFPVNADKYVVTDALFSLSKEEDIIVAGLCANKTTKVPGEFAAAFYQKINPRTLKSVTTDPKYSIRLFSKDFIPTFSQPRNGETTDQYYQFRLDKVAVLDNGGFVLLGEQYYESTKSMIDPGTKVETKIYYYHYNDILAVGADKDGKFAWNITVPKSQLSTDDNGYYHSYASVIDGNKIKIIYNDNPPNADIKDPMKIKVLKNNPDLSPKGLTIVTTIYADGSSEKDPLFKKEFSKIVICPKLIGTLSGRYLIYGQDRSYYRFGSFVFE